MSGGSLDYFYCQLNDHIGDFKDKELDDLVADLADLFHDREWYLSSDIGEGEWNEARDKFKQKWFGEGARAERIEQYLDEVKSNITNGLETIQEDLNKMKHLHYIVAGSFYTDGDYGIRIDNIEEIYFLNFSSILSIRIP